MDNKDQTKLHSYKGKVIELDVEGKNDNEMRTELFTKTDFLGKTYITQLFRIDSVFPHLKPI